jgi:hypothetical protein
VPVGTDPQIDEIRRRGEKLLHEVRVLVDHYTDPLVDALTASMGDRDRAAAFVDQLDHLAKALYIELYRKGKKPSVIKTLAISFGILTALTGVPNTLATEATKDVYDHLFHAHEASSDVVEQCVTVVGPSVSLNELVNRVDLESPDAQAVPVSPAVERDLAGEVSAVASASGDLTVTPPASRGRAGPGTGVGERIDRPIRADGMNEPPGG